jgi:hypothetical protein
LKLKLSETKAEYVCTARTTNELYALIPVEAGGKYYAYLAVVSVDSLKAKADISSMVRVHKVTVKS